MQRFLFLAGLLLCLAPGCSAPPLPLDEPLGSGQVRAGKVRRDSELIGGPVAYGRSGEVWKLYNSRARFLIQDKGTSVGLDLYGGNLIDADVVRPGASGHNGNDLFRETFPIVGLRACNPTAIELVADGSKGGPAQLRVHASDAPSGILPQLDVLAKELGGEITTDYILAADTPYLEIVTTYTAPADQELPGLQLGDFLSFGASLTILSPENGYTGSATEVSFVAAVGDGTSYGYVYPDGPLALPLVDASGTVTLLKNPAIKGGDVVQMRRFLVVGDGDAASVLSPMYALRGIATQPLNGVVRDSAGRPVAGARVTMFAAPLDLKDPKQQARSQANSGSDGTYSLRLPAGDYVAVVSGVGRLRSSPLAVALDRPRSVDLQAGPSGLIGIDIGELIDGKRQPVPAKVSFVGQNVESPDPRFGPDPTEDERNGVHAMALTADGQGQARLKPGSYSVVVSRGPEYELLQLPSIVVPPLVDEAAAPPVTVRGELLRSVDTHGWISGDYHQHTQGSIDSPVPLRQRVLENLAEGVELPASTDHDNITDYRPHIASLHAEPFINAVAGDEISVNGIGHFNAYPLTVDPQDPYAKIGAKLWANLSIFDMVKRVRGLEPTDIIVHVSHPRTKSLSGYFNSVHYDPIAGGSDEPQAVAAFDAIEVNGDLGQPTDYLVESDAAIKKRATQGIPSGVPTLRDFFSFLNQGRTVCALGNSDSHQRNDNTGYPRNYLLLGHDSPRQVKPADLVAAIRQQQVTVSNGPFLTVLVNGQAALGKAQAQSLGGASSALLNVRIQAPAWVPVSTIEVYENGRPLTLQRVAAGRIEAVAVGTSGAGLTAAIQPGDGLGALRFDGTIRVSPSRDAYYVVVVRGSGSLLPVAGGSAYAYNNPVYVDVAGDGWVPSGQ